MKTALILGINGAFGGHVARQLRSDGWKIRALMRDPRKLGTDVGDIDIICGDAENSADVERAASGVELLVYGINPPYNQWEEKALATLEISTQVAERKQLRMVFPGNVYAFQPDSDTPVSESTAFRPRTRKGEIRSAMEQRLETASQHGAKVLIVRCGDYIGKDAVNTWMRRLIKRGKSSYQLTATGPRDLKHTWAYLPDVAKTVSELLRQPNLSEFDVYNYGGYRISFADIAQTIEARTGKSVKIVAFPWWILRLLAPFSSMIRSVLEMRYLWDLPLNLNESKLQQALTPTRVPRTALDEALVGAELIEA